MSLIKKPVLLLNSSFEPIRIIPVHRALTMLTKGKVVVVSSSQQEIYPGVFVPSVIRLVEFKYIPLRMQLVSKKNIYLRDDHTCQYCGVKKHGSELTLDHIMPRSRGGKNTWENLVTACKPCNGRKDDRTPEEAGMVLRHRVIPSTVHTARSLLRAVGLLVNEWARYLFVDSAGDQRFATYG
jgi:5-methylcytosine-specific restriction endonuclease McrA